MKLKSIYISTLLTTSSLSVALLSISCAWNINQSRNENKDESEELNDVKFTSPVMPGWNDLNIIGKNQKEWLRLKEIYDNEIYKGESQLKDLDWGIKEFKDLQDFHKAMGGVLLLMVNWYQQIMIEIEFNLWMILNQLDIQQLLLTNEKNLKDKAKSFLNKIIDDNGLYNAWIKTHQDWKSFMKSKFKDEFSNQDELQWEQVKKHLNHKNNYFNDLNIKLQ